MKQAGLTIVEITVAIGLAAIVTIGLLPLFLHLFTDGSRTAAEAAMQQEGDTALATIAGHVAKSKDIVAATSPIDTQEPAGAGWTGSGSVLILKQIATTLAPQNPNRKPVTRDMTAGMLNCTWNTEPVYIHYVFYIHNATLLQRTIGSTMPASWLCDGATIYQQTSCLTCSDKPKDIILARNVESFSINYTPEDPGETNPYANTDVVRMSLTLKTDNYKYTSTTSARLLLAGSN